MKRYTLHNGDNREVLKTFEDNSIDSIVCDPPYELGFMGKRWDSTGIAYDVTLWMECLRVLKPGGHLLAFGGSRTYHRLAVAIEDAGFEIRDQIQWIYGSGFPKSLDVSKALDKVIGTQGKGFVSAGHDGRKAEMKQDLSFRSDYGYKYQPNTPLAQQWQGWGTALKPAHEPIVVARKPLQGTVADNVQAWGVGALNIDGCRVGGDDGRWPANIILDEEAAQMLDEQSGVSKSVQSYKDDMRIRAYNERLKQAPGNYKPENTYSDSGGASRFFYVAKVSKAEREASLETSDKSRANYHPTVKPIALMRYLVRMVTPRDGVVLDPFMGSGTTGCAAMLEGVRFIGIELNEEYSGIAERRIRYWMSQNMMGI